MREHGGTAMAMRAGLRAAATATLVMPATAQAADNGLFFGRDLAAGEIVLLAILIGAVTFAVLSAITLINARNRAENENSRLRLEVADLKAATERVEALAASEDQRLVAWGAPGEAPLVAGSISESAGTPKDRATFLAFGTWLQPESAARLSGLAVGVGAGTIARQQEDRPE